jgi:hypothetical protein
MYVKEKTIKTLTTIIEKIINYCIEELKHQKYTMKKIIFFSLITEKKNNITIKNNKRYNRRFPDHVNRATNRA